MKTLLFAVIILSIAVPSVLDAQSPAQSDSTLQSPMAVPTANLPIRNFATLAGAHATYTREFASKPGFGAGRILFLPPQNYITLNGIVYRFNTPELIGLEDEPVVYQRAGGVENISVAVMSKKETRSRLTRRPMTAIESNAVVELRAGKDLVSQFGQVDARLPGGEIVRAEGIRAVGSLRASADCADCHGVKKGTLLGAFSYSLVPTNALAARPNLPSAPAVPSSRLQTNINLTLTTRIVGGAGN